MRLGWPVFRHFWALASLLEVGALELGGSCQNVPAIFARFLQCIGYDGPPARPALPRYPSMSDDSSDMRRGSPRVSFDPDHDLLVRLPAEEPKPPPGIATLPMGHRTDGGVSNVGSHLAGADAAALRATSRVVGKGQMGETCAEIPTILQPHTYRIRIVDHSKPD